jgi:carbon monoxide dehydrogenase subunit G
MASIRREFLVNRSAAQVWDALRDFGAVHERLVPGFVLDAKMDDDARIVTFANGSVARETLVTIDDADRRIVYMIQSERLKHHNASAQVFADGTDQCRFVWITDVLPDDIVPYINGQMDLGVDAMKRNFAG